jgi:hypothetical protein
MMVVIGQNVETGFMMVVIGQNVETGFEKKCRYAVKGAGSIGRHKDGVFDFKNGGRTKGVTNWRRERREAVGGGGVGDKGGG